MPEESTDRSYEYNVQVKDNHGEWKTYGGWSWTTRGDFTMELLDSPEDAIWKWLKNGQSQPRPMTSESSADSYPNRR